MLDSSFSRGLTCFFLFLVSGISVAIGTREAINYWGSQPKTAVTPKEITIFEPEAVAITETDYFPTTASA